MCSGSDLIVYEEKEFKEKNKISFEFSCHDLTFNNDWIMVGLGNGRVGVLEKTNY